jgi:hypothetical protein
VVGNDSTLTVKGGVTITNAGTVEIQDGKENNMWGTYGYWEPTSLAVSGGDVTLTGRGTLSMTGAMARVIGTEPGDRLLNVDNTIRGSGQIGYNTLSVVNEGVVEASVPDMPLTIDPGEGGMVNTGTLRAANGATLGLKDGTFANSGLVDVQGGSRLEITGEFTQTSGTTSLNGGTITSTSPLNILGGSIRGTGDILADVLNEGGIVSPGFSPGTLTIYGDYTQGASGILQMELGGLVRGHEYDALVVTGNMTLAGTLDVMLYGGFNPSAGNSFDILDWAHLIGIFDVVDLPALNTGLQWDMGGLYTTGTLSVYSNTQAVPLPAGVLLGVLGLATATGLMRKWHRPAED